MGGRWVEEEEDCWWQKISMIITGNGMGMVSVPPDVDVKGGKLGEFWSLTVLILKCVSWQPSATSTLQSLHPSVKTGLPSAVLKTDSTDWNILNYCRCVSILFRKYISILFCKKHSDYNTASILSTYLDTTTILVSISISEQKIFWKFIVM